MFALKPISRDSVPSALAKAERYRLLNEPTQAESICRDILEVDPQNQQALVSLILALTDDIAHDASAFTAALQACKQLHTEYDRAYYSGIAWERRALANYRRGTHGLRHSVYEWIVQALHYYGQAEKLREPGNDDPVLRWNTCIRFLDRHSELTPRGEEAPASVLSE